MKNKFRFLVLFVAISSLLTTSIFAQFSRNDAIDLVLNTILAGDIGKVDVYASNNSFTTDVELIDNDSPSNPYTESWVFFSNDNPFASWYHSSRIIYVSSADGSYSILNVEIYPKGLSSDYEEISLSDRPDPVAMDGTAFVPDPQKVESNYNYALIIVSMDESRNWYNTSLIYNVLKQNYNYKDDNIFVLYNYDGYTHIQGFNNNLDNVEPENDIDGPATMENIQSTIENLTATLGHGDQLAVFFTGVPVNTNYPEPKMGFPVNEELMLLYPVSDISEPIEDIDCGQMIFTFDVNSSSDISWYFEAENGTNVKCANRYLHGPTGTGEKNYAEMYFSGGDFSEHLFYWASAARGYLPDVFNNAPWAYIDIPLGYENSGGFPYAETIPNHPGDNVLDDDDDGFIQMGEAFQYADDMNTWTEAYCHIPYISGVPSVNPHQTDEFPFVEDLITLGGISGYILNSQILPSRSYIIADHLHIDENVSITFPDNTELYINRNDPDAQTNSTGLTTYSNSELTFGNNMFVTTNMPYLDYDRVTLLITGTSFNVGTSNEFRKVSFFIYPSVTELFLTDNSFLYSTINVSMLQNFTMDACIFDNSEITINNPQNALFDGCFLYYSKINVFGSASSNFKLQHSYLYGNPIGLDENYTLSLISVKDYFIHHNEFINGRDGIYIENSGWYGVSSEISDNTIENTEFTGLTIFSSKAYLSGNKIFNNLKGLQANNNSALRIIGNSSAEYVHETQEIYDNEYQELITDESSFPYMRWNAIYDENNNQFPEDVLIYCEEPVYYEKDVRHNFFGINFEPGHDFFPAQAYYYEPLFKLKFQEEDKSDAELLYDSGLLAVENSNYSAAENIFKDVVELYPESPFARESIKDIYSLENNENGNYNSLKQYFLSDLTIINDTVLNKMGDYFANQCDIKLENWQAAITWFENIIQNPPSFADSIYAIIGLQNTYLLMQQNGYKSTQYIGNLNQYVPASHEKHIKYAGYLLSLLPKGEVNDVPVENLKKIKSGELLQNIPNPFSYSTDVWFKLNNESNVRVVLYDYTGTSIQSYNLGNKTPGNHKITITSENLIPGVYFYSLIIDNEVTDSKKLIKIR